MFAILKTVADPSTLQGTAGCCPVVDLTLSAFWLLAAVDLRVTLLIPTKDSNC